MSQILSETVSNQLSRFYNCTGNKQKPDETMDIVQSIKSKQVEDLITKFFYRDNHLCFQILLNLKGNEMVIYKEYIDYSEYKKAFNELQKKRTKNKALTIPNKSLKARPNSIKVA